MTIKNILIVDDEPIIRNFLFELLASRGYAVATAENTKQAKQKIARHLYDCIISDMSMPDGSGLDVLKAAKARCSTVPVLIITAYGTIENAVEATRLGAANYLTKPFSSEALFASLEQLGSHSSKSSLPPSSPSTAQDTQAVPLIAHSPAMRALLEKAKKAANSSANIFIHGESGSGKEVLSLFIHQNSPRASHPYIKVNCAAIPETLLESEFFGHEKGAFTGASSKKAGRFELANQGTLLLDEITEIPTNLQAKLLRVIQEKEFEYIGGTKTIPVDVRILATSNRDIKEAVEERAFRLDLYYRLNVIGLHTPPLRERKEDILPLANYFLNKFCQLNNKPLKTLSERAQETLLDYSWPGNIRELSNVMERVVILENPSHLTESMLAI